VKIGHIADPRFSSFATLSVQPLVLLNRALIVSIFDVVVRLIPESMFEAIHTLCATTSTRAAKSSQSSFSAKLSATTSSTLCSPISKSSPPSSSSGL
jgi:hypothetical protein